MYAHAGKYLWGSNHSSILNSLRDQSSCNPVDVWIGSHAFPIPSPSRNSTDRSYERSQGDMNAFAAVLITHSPTICIHKPTVKGRSQRDARRESGDELLAANAIWRIGEAQGRNAKARDCSCLSHTWAGMTVGYV